MRRAANHAAISLRRRNAQMARMSSVSMMQALATSGGIVAGSTPSISP